MPDHKVVVRKERHYPFRPFWVCVCGHVLKTEAMTYELYREFADHVKEEKERDRRNRRDAENRSLQELRQENREVRGGD